MKTIQAYINRRHFKGTEAASKLKRGHLCSREGRDIPHHEADPEAEADSVGGWLFVEVAGTGPWWVAERL